MAPLLASPTPAPVFDAVVLAAGSGADLWVAGLTLRERGARTAARAGARRVFVAAAPGDLAHLPAWYAATEPAAVLIVRAHDQLVHPPLVAPLLSPGADARRLAVTPSGDYAGALFAGRNIAADTLAALQAAGPAADHAIADTWRARPDATAVEHGAVARCPVRDHRDRRAAARYLERIVHKPQDGPVTRYLYRPVSLRLTRVLLHTPITPNQISVLVALLGVVGAAFAAQAAYASAILGTAIILAAGYIDGCDGELARLTLRSSRLGAWLDTITDEATTILTMAALGWHVAARHGEPWIPWTILLGLATYGLAIYGIYYYLIVVAGSANSQDYVGDLEIVRDEAVVRLQPRPPTARHRAWPPAVQAVIDFVPHVVRRDFINWGVFLFAVAHLTHIAYALLVLGGVGTCAIVLPAHVRLRRQLREIAGANPGTR
jgi:phosphatidylglycerophosphate synthase